MTTTVNAVYRDGVLRPDAPLPLADGTAVRVVVLPTADPAPAPPSGQDAAAVLLAIAERHRKDGPVEYTSRDHDKILYDELQQ